MHPQHERVSETEGTIALVALYHRFQEGRLKVASPRYRSTSYWDNELISHRESGWADERTRNGEGEGPAT